ncbi:MAG: bifunctional diaminohydroxyphosphoribosylaminopyrimidine deaminase/5-amino-6-(5-phosphoribosylamino)uracil reductase RibD [Chloroflexi bacterium]|nr:MAG: bifunctional diaminohydroxyphosphoribosylaminopyrimidine deaminase/5-amino-6-(5-phosphoribosylamino)uracil reductase RibD [Chloroflexota bacterium]TMF77508.1 MAG: bifunctional diaminohydroxyphosphoribosylaminopyrimidine deaminase/5-amino-6-(5-phosphoribosylamino)uracil reductase RibD [Chloroflexota bacterium]
MTADLHRPWGKEDSDRSADLQWSARALELAAKADFRTSPNPMVGAVVLDREGQLAGEGYHRAAGEPHAEQEALAQAGERARGGTLYVNLEPCTHAHRNPCCADAVIELGVRRAVISMTDPDERVRGAGVKALEAAGVQTIVGIHEQRARSLNEFYIKHRLTGTPFVSAKFALSIDGKIATRSGESRWITGEKSRLHAHRLRHQHDAILVGINTVIADDPELTARLDGEEVRQPLRIVLDSQLRIRQSARVVGPNTLIATTRPGRVGLAEVLKLPATGEGRVSLPALLDELGKRKLISVLVEGGGEVHAALFAARLVDKVYAYIAPKLIGGRDAPGPLGGQGIEHLTDAMALRDLDVTRLGDDLLISAYVDVHRDR